MRKKINKGNWTGEETVVNFRKRKRKKNNESYQFEIHGEEFEVQFSDEFLENDLGLNLEVIDKHGNRVAYGLQLSTDGSWLVRDDGEAIERAGKDPLELVAQVLFNII